MPKVAYSARFARSVRNYLQFKQAKQTNQIISFESFRDCYVLDLLDLYRRKVIDLYDTCFLHCRAPFYQGKSTIAIEIRLVAESVKFNPSIGFWLIESIEFSKVFCDWFNECSIAFQLHSIPFDCYLIIFDLWKSWIHQDFHKSNIIK